MALTGKRLDFPSPPRRKTPPGAWPAFESKLAEALAVLEEDQFLVITEKRGWAYVQFAGQGSFGVRTECVSNNYLDEAHALRAGQMTALRRIGWSAPAGTPAEASPKRQPEGSPNFSRDFGRPVPYDAVARMAVRSLTGVFEIPQPGYLHYKAFDKSKRRFFVVDGRVIVAAEMFVAPFVAEHVTRACLQVGSLADEIGGTLRKDFGGRTAFEDARDEPEVQ